MVGLGQGRDELTARLVRRDGHTSDTVDAEAPLVVGEKRDAPGRDTGVRGSMPLLGFLDETPLCLVDELREGNVSPGGLAAGVLPAGSGTDAGGKRLARYRAESASYQAALSNEWEADEGRWASTADQDAVVKALMAGVPAEAWQAPEPGCGEQVADAVHTMHATKAAFRLSLTREKWPRKFAQADQWRICSR